MATNDSNKEDLQSLNLIRQGGKMRDKGMFELHRKYAKELQRRISYKGHLNDDDAKDVVQDTFIKIDLHCESYSGDSPLAAWIWRIACNCMNDHFRRIKARPAENLDEEEWLIQEQENESLRTFDSLPSTETLEDCINRGLASFAQNFGERAYVLSLILKDGLDTVHIAAAIQRTPGATREYISQCYKRAREFFVPCQGLRS